jgi:hypothetical protein
MITLTKPAKVFAPTCLGNLAYDLTENRVGRSERQRPLHLHLQDARASQRIVGMYNNVVEAALLRHAGIRCGR